MPDEPGLGEAHRRLDRIQTRIDNHFVSLSTYRAERSGDRELIAKMHSAVDKEIADLRLDLQSIEERLTWAWRAAVTGVILPLVISLGVLIFRGTSGGP